MRPQNIRVLATAGAVSLATMGLVAPVAAAPQSAPVIAAAQPASTPGGPPLVLEYEREFGGPTVFPKGDPASAWLREPFGITVDPVNPEYVYVAAGNKLVRWSNQTGFASTDVQAAFGRITDVAAVAMSGSTTRLIVTDWGRYSGNQNAPIDPADPVDPIAYSDSWGAPFVPLAQIEGIGAGKNAFSQPWGIAAGPDRKLYVADTENQRVQVIEAFDGESLRGWGGWGDGPMQFDAPTGIAVGPDGSVYVADEGFYRNTISKFTSNGTFVTSWQSSPTLGMSAPRAVDVGPDGNVYVVHYYGGVSVFSPDGNLISSFAESGPPGSSTIWGAMGLAVGADGRVYVSDSLNFRVAVLRKALTGAAGTVSGSVKVGSTLTATGEQWSVTPNEVTYQWLRGATAIPGATAKTYKPVLADVGHQLSVRVTASKLPEYSNVPAYADATVTSTRTAKVPAVASSVELSASKATQVYAATSPVTLTASVRVTAGASTAGRVEFRHGAKLLGSAAVSASGSAQLTLPRKLAVGTQSLTAVFVPGSAQVAGATSSALEVQVTKAAAKVTTKLLKASVKRSQRAKLRIKVKVTGIAKPTGKVKVTWAKGKKKVSKTYKLKAKHKGSITIRLPKLAKGKYKVSTRYQGSSVVEAKKGAKRSLRVR